MREIKFRVFFYDGTDKKTGEYVDFETAWQENYIDYNGHSLEPTDECSIIEQYTGLKDKNGKEIYEGDIVKGKYAGSPNFYTNKIEFKEGCFILATSELWAYESLEVIGNIHQDKHLLD